MHRRHFLHLLAGLPLAGSMASFPARAAAAQRVLVNIMCVGGADFRFLLAPDPADGEYAAKFWEARRDLYNINGANYASYEQMFADLYLPTASPHGGSFGILRHAAWLQAEFNAGRVAIICNVAGSGNRRHDHSQLIINSGDVAASQYNLDRDGWGGRLVETLGQGNVVAVTDNVSIFCKGSDPARRNARVIQVRDSRNFALSHGKDPIGQRMARALKNYYASKEIEAAARPADWPYHRFLQHEAQLRRFGDDLRLLTDSHPIPANLSSLQLHNPLFHRQCGNLYDSYTAAELLQMRVVSVDYNGWDTHRLQRPALENNFADLFGSAGGLATLAASLPAATLASTVFVFTSDFGRQLRANGNAGTDHGSGNYMLLLGPAVQGGIYGAMFPRREITASDGHTPYDAHGTDILGLTSFERVLARTCDWLQPGSGVRVFPRTVYNDLSRFPQGPALENGVDLTSLLA